MKSTKDKELFAKYLLCRLDYQTRHERAVEIEPIYFVNHQKHNFQLLILGFCRKFSTLVSECALPTDKVNKNTAISMASMKMLGNFQVEKVTQERLIINRTFPGWTAIGVTRSRSCGFMCLEKTLCYYIIILGVLGTETEGNIHTDP